MREALKEAEKAYRKGEVPVGAVITFKGKIIARGYNQTMRLNDSTAHAEILAIKKAAKYLKNFRLNNTVMYVTIEPCSMCAGALIWARVGHLIYGVSDVKSGACGSVTNIVQNKTLNHQLKVTREILEEDCKNIIQKFFKEKRRQK